MNFTLQELRLKLIERFVGEIAEVTKEDSIYQLYKSLIKDRKHISFDSPSRIVNPITKSILVENVTKQYFPNIYGMEAARYVILNDFHFMKRCIMSHCVFVEERFSDDYHLYSALRSAIGNNLIVMSDSEVTTQLPQLFQSFSSFSNVYTFRKSIRNKNFCISTFDNDADVRDTQITNIHIIRDPKRRTDHEVDLVIFTGDTNRHIVSTSDFHVGFFKRLLQTNGCNHQVDKMIVTYPHQKQEQEHELTAERKKHCVFLVDNRANIWSVLSAMVTLSNLDRSLWDFVVCSHPDNYFFFTKHFPGCYCITDFRMDLTDFSPSIYSDLLKDYRTWEKLEKYEKCLIIQEDGMIIKKGLETSDLMKYDFVGAPWSDVIANQRLKRYSNDLVGNGGLSLRTVSVMEECCLNHVCVDIAHELWMNDTDVIPEDVFFSKAVRIVGGSIPSTEEAKRFSSEQILNYDAFGFHKFWPYHSQEESLRFISHISHTNHMSQIVTKPAFENME